MGSNYVKASTHTLDTPSLTNGQLVWLVVAGQIEEDTRRADDDVLIAVFKQLHQRAHQRLDIVLGKRQF